MTSQFTHTALAEELPSWGVLVLESHHSPQFTMEWRQHKFLKIVYVLSGSGKFHFRQRQDVFSAGDVVIVPPRVDNRIEDDPASASSLYVCCIATSLFRFDNALLGRVKTQCIRRDGHFANRVSSLMRRLVHEQSRNGPTRAVAMVSESLRLVQMISRRRGLKASRSKPFKTTG